MTGQLPQGHFLNKLDDINRVTMEMKKGDQNFRKNYFAGPASVALISRLLIMEIKCQINRKLKMFHCCIFVFMREHF